MNPLDWGMLTDGQCEEDPNSAANLPARFSHCKEFSEVFRQELLGKPEGDWPSSGRGYPIWLITQPGERGLQRNGYS
jgi:hypothetical protein